MTVNLWLAYIAGGALTLLLGAIAVLLIINADQRATIASDDAARSMLQAQNQDWAQKVMRTNVALTKIRTAEATNAKAIAVAQKAALTAETKLKIEAASIGNFSFIGNECDEVMAVKQAYMEHLR